ncbi:hypothetical protein BV898_01533 [Hypsibius exemplaris]|uniref:MARVEL domain-containing protein n=1 Tax=Hypsibius exemplaris TaxID=2072580 RepID=A0A1W0XAA5_HYPEX|nr:hypothetical protein BV898_01533 [Hypsibius exemplaris]
MARRDRISTDKVMKILGLIHMAFGFAVMMHQAGCALTSWAYMNYNMFEDAFKPGLWLGAPIFLLGVACFYQYRFPRPALHMVIMGYTLFVLAVCIFFMVFKVRFIIHDPEVRTFQDCDQPRWPKSFILDDMPHCNALKLNNSFGQSMLAFASADILVCIIGLGFICSTKYAFESLRYLPPNGNGSRRSSAV